MPDVPLYEGLKGPLNKVLKQLHGGGTVRLSPEFRRDLLCWGNFLSENSQWHPIARRHDNPPLACRVFTSDAAGWVKESRDDGKRGCGNLGLDVDGTICLAMQTFWPHSVTDLVVLGDNLGCKTASLEFCGILLPFVLFSELMANQYVVVKVDNIGCYFGWVNRQSAGDYLASMLIRCLHLIRSYLACQVHIEHLPRKSNWEACLVDRLSREKTTWESDRKLVESFGMPRSAKALSD